MNIGNDLAFKADFVESRAAFNQSRLKNILSSSAKNDPLSMRFALM